MASVTGFLLILLFGLSGCGTGGYIGGGITSLSRQSAVIDAGQSIPVTASVSKGLNVAWTLGGASCTGASCGTVSTVDGFTTTYTAPAGLTASMQVVLTATVPGTTDTDTATITVNPDPLITGTPPAGTVGVAYTSTLTTSGGTAPLTFVMASGALPAGLSFNAATGVISGTPTTVASSTAVFSLTDSSNVPDTVTASEVIAIGAATPPSVVTVTGTPGAGVVGSAYSSALLAAGGTTPYTWSVATGALPTGLTLGSATGVISGIPTTAGTYTFTAQAQDAKGVRGTASFSITVVALGSLTLGTLPNGTVNVAYSSTIAVAGGILPYSCAITAGTLPAGLSLGANCLVSGTPTTAGTATVSVKATDSSNPSLTVTGPETITISPAALSLTSGSLPNGTVAVPYSAIIGVAGGTSPYSCTITSGALPAGLTLGAACLVSGTPTTAGTTTLSVKATDASNPTLSVTGPETIVINAGAAVLTIASPPTATVGTPYTGTIVVTGGTGPYTCALTAGTLPAGLTLGANCVVTGTPTTPGSTTITVKGTDSSNPVNTNSGPVTITVSPMALALATGTLPNGTVGVVYSSTIGVTGGTSPYSCAITSGTLPAGLTLGASCLVSGTPTTAGTTTVTVKATDSSNPILTVTGTETITISPAPLSLTAGSLPSGTVAVPYSATIGVAGGTAPYTCSITSGTLPAGLTLGAACLVSGTPTTAGTTTVTVKATDASNPTLSVTGPQTIVINPGAAVLVIASPPPATVGTPYTGPIGVTGGTGPYTCAITAGTLPAGLTLGANCVVTGTPTAPGTVTVTVKGTDSSNPPDTGTGPITITVSPSALSLTSGILPNGTVAVPYSASIGVAGGTSPYTCAITSGTLPAGLTLGAACLVSGTPTTAGTTTVTVKATDASNPTLSVTGPQTILISPAALSLASGTLPGGTVGVVYSSTLPVTGGTSPYSCSITAGTLPAGLTLGAGCLVSGTPTTAGTTTVTIKATDSSNPVLTNTATESITISPAPLSLTAGSLPSGTVAVPYSATIGVAGGTAPYTCSITSGTLPAGLTLGAACLVSGTPTTPGSSTVTVKATDSSNPTLTTTGPETIVINAGAAVLTIASPPPATINTPYTGTIGVTGGTGPYTCSITSGTLPAGLTLGANCIVTGTPTTAGSTTVTVKATDSSNPANTNSGPVTIVVAPAALGLASGTLPNGTVAVPYSATIGVTGGTAPYTCAITSGTLPAGLTLGASCLVSGTPTTAGSTTVTVKATDSANPALTTTGPETITISPAALALASGTLPNGTVAVPYSATIGVTGGTAPYTCAITSGTLPAGLTLGASCLVSGTPTTPGTTTVTVKATDSANPAQAVTGPETITISPAALGLASGTLPNGTVAVPYSATIGVTGGTAPYTCAITSGTLPAGLTLGASCLVSGTPTTPGTTTVTVKATDSANPAQTVTGPETIIISPAAATLVITSPPAATVGTPYTGTVPVTGGNAPYTCVLTAGTLPAGLTLGANCIITGTPTTPGAVTVTVKATDSSNPTNSNSGPVTVTVNPANPTLTLTPPPAATVGTPYTGTIGVSGGTSPYTCTINSGTLPAGLTLGPNCTLTGTPTTPGTTTVTVTATGTGTSGGTVTGPVLITVNPAAIVPLTFTGSLPNAILGVAYTHTLAASGGVGPYTYAVTAGALPPGISLSSTGVVSGIPTAVGASSFTVTATDSESTPQTAALPLVLLVVYPTTPNDAELKGPYAFLFQGYDDAVAGVLSYKTATAGSFTADGAGVASLGELDANHQYSAPAGNTIATQTFIGTYTIGTDNRGFLAVTTLNTDGTVNHTTIYAISVHAVVAPAAISTSGDLIEYDGDQLVGTRGSGTFLAQTPAAITAGLTGSYAFGLSGETPCLPACTVGVIAGPVASVGRFTTGAGVLSAGISDANIGSGNLPNLGLSGTYGAADANGRVQLGMATTGTTPGFYPQDYAVYVVDAGHAFILSTDKHSSYILLAGTAQAQTTAVFTGASLSGNYVGYENSPTNPGIAGVALQSVLNLSTATIFRGTADGVSSCNTTNVDSAGVTALVNGLTGLGSGSNVLNALLGTYQSTGTSTCTIAASGRGVLNYPAPSTILSTTLTLLGLGSNPPAPRVLFLSGQNQGYFLETGYAGLGNIELQVGSPYTVATLKGTYVYGSSPAASAASINSSGIFTADGLGHATTTLDMNIGVGTINVLQLGVAGTFNYTLTDANAGRYLLGATTVLYAITPTRYVLIDENPLTTSPSVALIY